MPESLFSVAIRTPRMGVCRVQISVDELQQFFQPEFGCMVRDCHSDYTDAFLWIVRCKGPNCWCAPIMSCGVNPSAWSRQRSITRTQRAVNDPSSQEQKAPQLLGLFRKSQMLCWRSIVLCRSEICAESSTGRFGTPLAKCNDLPIHTASSRSK